MAELLIIVLSFFRRFYDNSFLASKPSTRNNYKLSALNAFDYIHINKKERWTLKSLYYMLFFSFSFVSVIVKY